MTTGDDLRGLMRLWPHGVSILSIDVDGDRMGVTVSSLVSLSLEPPLVGVSIGKEASCYELLRAAGRFAVSLLGSEQGELAQRFAAGYPPIVHWEGVPTREGTVAPLIDGALGWIEAKTREEADAGDHTFFIADVLSIEHGPSRNALVYRESTYHSV
jgi:flavin reductase (DIM6/NTAB) family NADH-FMN oxidoreductase RutF